MPTAPRRPRQSSAQPEGGADHLYRPKLIEDPLPAVEPLGTDPLALLASDEPDASGTERSLDATIDLDAPDNEIFLPVYGLVRLTNAEIDATNHPAFQRLTEINQLGMTYLVYPGATHKRAEHALGTLHMATVMLAAVDRNLKAARAKPVESGENWLPDKAPTQAERAFVRLGALLHDIGHLANGHTFEDELSVLPPHDADERLLFVLDKTEWQGEAAEPLRDLIERNYGELAHDVGAPDAVALLLDLISKDRTTAPDKPDFRTSVCRDLIGNTLCADLLDYLHRDWHHIGKPKALDLRLLDYLEIRRNDRDALGAAEKSRLVVNLRGGTKLRTDAVTGILDLLESRYQLGEIALFHRTKINATAMLERAVAELAESKGSGNTYFASQLDALLSFDDRELLSFLDAELANSSLHETDKQFIQQLLHDIRLRRLHKLLKAWHPGDLRHADRVQVDFGGDVVSAASKDMVTRQDSVARAARNRLMLARALEADFGLERGSVAVYCPPSRMNTKVAEVKVLVDGELRTLDEHEQSHSDGLTGGHLKAQKERFRRLWRFHVAISTDAMHQLQDNGLLQVLIRTVEWALSQTEHERAENLADELARRRKETWPDSEGYRIARPNVASRSDATFGPSYPNGEPLLTEFIV